MSRRIEGVKDEKFGHIVRILLTLLKYGDKPLTVSELKDKAKIPGTAFFSHIKRSLEMAGWVTFKVNPDRTITAHLTDDGRKIAEALKNVEDILRKANII
ncbi:MAG: hypothetical protein B6U85_00490 [Desulfurococcales archaeon ex4484_42]|nr:MAG: hypothetical protein B6U85_00490 [Desulfurococcales archaeon ex4484_42]